MDLIYPSIYRIVPDRPLDTKYISFFVRRRAGNLLFPCYSSRSDIADSLDEIEGMGGLSMQLLADSHFKTPHADEVAKRFKAPLLCSEPELADVAKSVKSVKTFPLIRHELAKGVEVIPTPGHRPGGCCYLITIGKKKYLFSGDEIWHNPKDGWMCYPTKSGRKKMIASIEALRDLRFDVIIANTTVGDKEFAKEFTDIKARARFLDGLISTMQDGA